MRIEDVERSLSMILEHPKETRLFSLLHYSWGLQDAGEQEAADLAHLFWEQTVAECDTENGRI